MPLCRAHHRLAEAAAAREPQSVTPASEDRVRWLILVLVSVIIAVGGQPVPSVAAASIVCTLASAAGRRGPHERDHWRRTDAPDGKRPRPRRQLRVPAVSRLRRRLGAGIRRRHR